MKKSISFILVMLMVLCLVPGVALAAWDGTTANTSWYNDTDTTFTISTAEQLAGVSELSANGNTFSGKKIILANDIDLSGKTWTPINSFNGEFDGSNYTIKNFHIDATSSRGGFFYKTSWANIHDLTLSDVTANVGTRFGTLGVDFRGTALNNITIKNVTATTTADGSWVSGFVPYMESYSQNRMANCTVENFVVNANAGAGFIAGIANVIQRNGSEAEKTNIIDNLEVKGFKVTVNSTNGCGVGGLFTQTQTGWQNPRLNNCDVTGIDVTATGLVDVGGFIAWPGSHTIAENCTTQGKIDATGLGSGNCAGGFFGDLGWNADLGQKGHKVTDCTADVDITTKFAPAGGFVGSATNSNDASMYAEFTNCEAKGDITCVSDGTADIGGFAGDADRGVYKNCSATGDVANNGTGAAGGFIGRFKDVTPKYEGRFPAGTREYMADEATLEDCQGSYYVTGKEEDKTGGLIGHVDDGSQIDLKGNDYYLDPIFNPTDEERPDVVDEGENELKDVPPASSPKPTSTGSGISITYNGGNNFSTSKSDVPTGVEIDGVPVTFNGDGRNFSVGCISSDAKWVTVRWNSTTVTTNFTPDALVECSNVAIPKTGDMPIWAAIAEFLGF